MKLVKLDKSIFREYDVRSQYGELLNEDVAYTFGRGYGAKLKDMGVDACIVGHDNRFSSPELVNGLRTGILESGINVIDIGLCTTPMFYFACMTLDINRGVMVTASHNPKEDNGFKFSFDNNQNAKGQEIVDFYNYIDKINFNEAQPGMLFFQDITDSYFNYLLKNIKINSDLKVVIDCGNGTTTFFAPELFLRAGVDLTVIYGKSDPSFPHHHPDPSVKKNLKILGEMVVDLNADVGIGFDGDGDRAGFVDDKGRFIDADHYLSLFMKNIAKKEDNLKFLYDVKCGKTLIDTIDSLGATGYMVRTGNSYTKALTKEYNCTFGGEYSGHMYFRDKFLGFDSGMYAGLRMLELLSETDKTLSELVDELPSYYSSNEIKIEVTDANKFSIIDKIKEDISKKGLNYKDIDGVRIKFDNGWGLIRASNTGPYLTVRVEGYTKEDMNKINDIINNLIDEYK